MADQPSAELTIDEPLVRALLMSQFAAEHPEAARQPLAFAAEGWDCAMWRLGDDLAVRLPRRAVAASLVRNEHEWMPVLAPGVEATGVRVPTPLFAGRPDADYPWPWSIVPWIAGTTGLAVARAERAGWAVRLADALGALHQPAPPDAPANPFRGVPLAARAESIGARFAALGAGSRLEGVWDAGLRAAVWAGPPVWIHGDLHPANLVTQGTRLAAIIDFGDLTAGDPAYDLAIAWLAFDATGRQAFIDATRGRYDDATWIRARAWAAAVTVIFLSTSDDNPAYADLAVASLTEITRR